jgi:hypothetical protein
MCNLPSSKIVTWVTLKTKTMKMKIFSLAILLSGITALSNAAGRPLVENQTMHLQSFHSLKVGGDIHVIISNSDDAFVSIPGGENSDLVTCTVEDGELVISQHRKSKEAVNVCVSTNLLQRLEAADHASISFDESIAGDALTVVVKDHGEVKVNGNAGEINAYVFQQGIIRVSGDYTCSSTYLKNYDVLVAKYSRNDGMEHESVLTKRL